MSHLPATVLGDVALVILVSWALGAVAAAISTSRSTPSEESAQPAGPGGERTGVKSA